MLCTFCSAHAYHSGSVCPWLNMIAVDNRFLLLISQMLLNLEQTFENHINGCVFFVGFFQVIKYKLCRCVKKKHKGHNNNDRGAVLSLDDVKRHVSGQLSISAVSNCPALTALFSGLCPHWSRLQLELRSRRTWRWWWWWRGSETDNDVETCRGLKKLKGPKK